MPGATTTREEGAGSSSAAAGQHRDSVLPAAAGWLLSARLAIYRASLVRRPRHRPAPRRTRRRRQAAHYRQAPARSRPAPEGGQKRSNSSFWSGQPVTRRNGSTESASCRSEVRPLRSPIPDRPTTPSRSLHSRSGYGGDLSHGCNEALFRALRPREGTVPGRRHPGVVKGAMKRAMKRANARFGRPPSWPSSSDE
jgi:hypothetical protein